MNIPQISDMSVLPVEAVIANRDMIFHFSSRIDGFFAIESRSWITYYYGDEDGALAGMSRQYRTTDMTGPIQMSEIVHYSGSLMYFPAVVNGFGCYVQIDPIDPEKLTFATDRSAPATFGPVQG